MNQAQTPKTALVACRDCDLVQKVPQLRPAALAECRRCGAHLRRSRGEAILRVLPMTIGALILFVIANSTPIVTIAAAGNSGSATFVGTISAVAAHGTPLVATTIAITALAAPALELVALLHMTLVLRARVSRRRVAAAVRIATWLGPWAMLEVFLLGALVSLVKLASVARVMPGVGLGALAGVVGLTAAARSCFDRYDYWQQLTEK